MSEGERALNRRLPDTQVGLQSTGQGKPPLDGDRVAEALHDSVMRYRWLLESAPVGILILDADLGTVVDVNSSLLTLLDYSYEAVSGKHLWDVDAFQGVAPSREVFNTRFDCGHFRHEDVRLRRRDGTSVVVECEGDVYALSRSRVIQCRIRDISRRRREEDALAASNAKFRSIMDNIGIGVALISPQMEILELNRRMQQWFPAVDPSRRAVCFRSFNDPPRDAICEYCPTRKTLQDGLVHEGETETPQVGGVRNYRIVSSPICDSSGAVVAAIEMVEDVTERRMLEAQLHQSQKMEAVGLLAGGVAHDYNNMLSVILGHAELALTKVDATHPLREDLEGISNAAMRSAEITHQLLAFARKQTIQPVMLDLNKAGEGMLGMLRRLIAEDIDVTWRPGTDLGPVMVDVAQLGQLLVNLCVNARDAMVGGGRITIETRNAVLDETFCAKHVGAVPGEYVLLRVSDNGSGMDGETLARIFEPFFTTKGAGRGTGLGLSTVYGIVKQNNGFIETESRLGKGSAFSIYFPRCAGRPEEGRPEESVETVGGGGETVLLVEDEPMLLTMSTLMLEELGYRVRAANSPGEAIRTGTEHASEIRLTISDVIMPEMNGLELAEQLRGILPDTPTLFMSGHTADVITQNGVLNEGVDFLQKPFSMQELGAKVLGAMRDKPASPSQGPTRAVKG